MSWKFLKRVKAADKLSKEAAYNIIKRPVTSEKSTLMSQHNQLMFDVEKSASKQEIKKAIEVIFDVKVKAVNTLIRKGKTRRFRGVKGQHSDRKLALVTLGEGQNLDLVSGV